MSNFMKPVVMIVVMIFFVVFCVGFQLYINFGTETKILAKIIKTERIVETSDEKVSSKYLIFTDKETFENTDSVFRLKFNSSDFYGKIEIGKTYEFTVVGFRIPFLSCYRNIVDFKEITNE